MSITRNTNRKLPKDSKTIPIYGDPVYGDGLDFGKYYHCWNCGAVCNIDVHALGDRESRSGVVLEDYVETPDRTGVCYTILKSPINHFQVCLANDSDGNPKIVRHSLRVSESSTGCPLCGSKNWRGDY